MELEKVVLSLGDFEGELAMMVTDERIKQIEEELKLPDNDADNDSNHCHPLASRLKPINKGKKKKVLSGRYLKRSTGWRLNQKLRDKMCEEIFQMACSEVVTASEQKN